MFKTKTAFVIGAGASCEFGLPSGEQLIEPIPGQIWFEFDHAPYPIKGDKGFFELVKAFVNQKFGSDPRSDHLNEYLLTCRSMSEGLKYAKSITILKFMKKTRR